MITAAVRSATGYAYNATFAQYAMTGRNAEAHHNSLENTFPIWAKPVTPPPSSKDWVDLILARHSNTKTICNMTTTMTNAIVLGEASSSPLTLHRMGYGTMRLTGPHIWGEPADRDGALQILKKATEAGVRYIDTADYYGLGVTNRLIAEALHAYPKDLVIISK